MELHTSSTTTHEELGGVPPAARRTNGARPQTEAALRLAGIRKQWPGMPRPVLEDVDLALEGGTAVWIGGANGVGKTTLLRIMTGAITPDQGTVELDGLTPEHDRREFQRRIAYLAAGDRGLYARLSVRRHLEFWASLALIPRSSRRALIGQALSDFALEDLAGRRADRLSMGQRQRVRIAGTFLHKPKVAMLDEPRNSLDDEGIAVLREAIDAVIARRGAVVWCSPSGERADYPFDTALELEAGKLRSG